MICPWCNQDYPVEFFEEHHKNHVHNDDRPENKIVICVKCHKRHHAESGYDTIIIKKDEHSPKTVEELMIDISREEFFTAYRERQRFIFQSKCGPSQLNSCPDLSQELVKWIKAGCETPFEGNTSGKMLFEYLGKNKR